MGSANGLKIIVTVVVVGNCTRDYSSSPQRCGSAPAGVACFLHVANATKM